MKGASYDHRSIGLEKPVDIRVGLGVGVVLVATGVLLAVVATGRVGAASPGGAVPACVNVYTGDVRMGYPGQTLTCNRGEVLIELNAGSPAQSLSYAVRTVVDDVSTSTFFAALRTVDCQAGEIAISGGSRLMRDGHYVNSSAFEAGMDGPVGSPLTGWMSGFEYRSSSKRPVSVVETWVLCVS